MDFWETVNLLIKTKKITVNLKTNEIYPYNTLKLIHLGNFNMFTYEIYSKRANEKMMIEVLIESNFDHKDTYIRNIKFVLNKGTPILW